MARLSFSKIELALHANVKAEINTKAITVFFVRGRALPAPRTTRTILLQDNPAIPCHEIMVRCAS